jgi:hypothetical protein
MARSAASYQAPPRASNSFKATNIANELLNASYSRVRTFHPVLKLDLPEIVMEGCGSESPDCKIVYKSVKNYSGCTHGACRRTESSVGPQVLANWLSCKGQQRGRAKQVGNCVQHQFLDSARGW